MNGSAISRGENSFRVTRNCEAALRRLRERAIRRFLRDDAISLYLNRYRTKYRGNLRLGPPFSEGFVLSRRLACSLSRSIYPCFEVREFHFH
jgi:hypothetical protein